MRELRFDGLSPDGTRLVLAGKDGQRWSVVIDERIEAAVRRDRARLSQVEVEQSGSLRPREIQARIRAGATAEDVAAASGLPVEHVRRFEGPVLTERAWVAQQARSVEVRRPIGDIELGELVAEHLQDEGVDPSRIAWDAWRRDDGMWVVIATFPIPPNTLVATWTYDTSARTMTAADDNARILSAPSTDAPRRLVSHVRPTLASVVTLPDPEPVRATAVVDVVASEAPDAQDEVDEAEPVATEGVDGDVAAGEDVAEGDLDDEAQADQPAVEPARAQVAGTEDAPDPDDAPGPGDAVDADDALEAGATPDADPEPGDDDGAIVDEDEVVPVDQAATSDAEDVPLFETPAPVAASRSGGRPPVPSFDDILFGPGPKKR